MKFVSLEYILNILAHIEEEDENLQNELSPDNISTHVDICKQYLIRINKPNKIIPNQDQFF